MGAKKVVKKPPKEGPAKKGSGLLLEVAEAMNMVMALEPPIPTDDAEQMEAGIKANLKEVRDDDFGDGEEQFSGKVAEYLKAQIAAGHAKKPTKSGKPKKEHVPAFTRKDAVVSCVKKIPKSGITEEAFHGAVIAELREKSNRPVGRLTYECRFVLEMLVGLSILSEQNGKYTRV